jgi:transposase
VNEIVGLSKTERDRLVVLRQVKEGKLTQAAGAQQLKLSARWVRKLVKRLRAEGDRGLAHRLRGRPSNRAHDDKQRRQALALIRERYDDYGPTLASEMLASEHQIVVNRETLRQWMSGQGLWKPRRAKLKKVHVWRPRRRCRGELVQWDTSDHDWLEGRGPRLYLVAMIDDATSELTAHFAASDSTAENMRLLWRYVELHGRPVEVYTDKASLFQLNRPLHHNKHLDAARPPTQIERALAELGISKIAAHSPQAKGRIERSFQTMQDRLVKGLRRAAASNMEEANRYLQQQFVAQWNERFTRPPAEKADAHRRLRRDQNLASILSRVEQRVVGNDYTVSWRGRRYQIPPEQAKPRIRKAAVRIEQRLNGELWLCWQQAAIGLRECVEADGTPARSAALAVRKTPAPTKQPSRRKRRWMDGFVLGDPAQRHGPLPATPVALRAPSVAGSGP